MVAPRRESGNGDTMRLSAAAAACAGTLHGADVDFCGGSSDSRSIAAGELFIALRGERADGHEFLAMVRERGAAAALVDHAVADPLPQLIVADTKLAMSQIAAQWRAQYTCPVIGLTGSNGKTTVKELLAAILSRRGSTLFTLGNFNNDIGLPLTLLRMRAGHRHAVIEMGANHPGEIAYLTGLTHPDIALITNAGPAHLEGFKTLEGVSRAKGEIYAGLSQSGVAIVNADDAYADYWVGLNRGRRVIRFGLSASAEVSAAWSGDASGSALELRTPLGAASVTLHLPGVHNVRNALAAVAAAIAAGATLENIVAGLQQAQGAPGRMQGKRGLGGARVIDDTYNANPASVRAAIDVLAACGGRRVLALGDLGELGGDAAELHRGVGEYAARAGIDALYTVGKLSANASSVFPRERGHFETQDALIAALRPQLGADLTLLVKGSRSARMENVVDGLVEEGQSDATH
jgi:UDP-N-acetylmuramoyl-tripeptide--D-alanyl-D-alanine ligase